MIPFRVPMRCLLAACLGGLAVVGLAAGGPSDMLKDLQTLRQNLIAQAREKSKGEGIDLNAIENQVRSKAEEDMKGLDIAKVPPAEAIDWAQICNAARHPREAQKILLAYVATKPEPLKHFEAETMLLAASWTIRDDQAACNALRDMKPYDSASAINRASFIATYAPHLTNVMPEAEAIGLIDKSVADVDTSGLNEQAKSKFETVRYAAELGKIEIYKQAGHREKAIAVIDEALKTATESEKMHLTVTRNQIALVGAAAPALKIERGYGQFPGLKALKGKVVVVDFFAHWCQPCILSFPEMRKMADDLQSQGLVVVGVTTYYRFYKDRNKTLTPDEEFTAMAGFVKEQSITWPVVFGPFDNFEAYGVTAIPHVVAIGRDGSVHNLDIGYSAQSFANFRKEVEALLAAKG